MSLALHHSLLVGEGLTSHEDEAGIDVDRDRSHPLVHPQSRQRDRPHHQSAMFHVLL